MGTEGAKEINLKVDKKTFKNFDETIQKQGETFVDALKKAKKNKEDKKLEEYTTAFNGVGKNTLTMIGKDMRDNFTTIDNTNKKAPKLETYIEAKAAFEEDIKTLNITDSGYTGLLESMQDFIDLKQISTKTDLKAEDLTHLKKVADEMNKKEEGSMDIINEEIQSKIDIVEEGKTQTTEDAINKNRTAETAKSFFETTGNENTFNIVFDEIAKISKDKLETYTATGTDKTEENKVKNFVELLKKYTKNDDISGISLETATDSQKKYPVGTRMIKYDIPTKDENGDITKKTEPKIITFGSQDKMQQRKAEAFDISNVDLSTKEKPLEIFDGNGNYRAFEKYIKANNDKFEANFKNVLEAILVYSNESTTTTDKDEKIDDLKNGYGTVITDYMVGHPTLMERYNTYVTTANLNLFGGDRDTRIVNYNKLTPLWKKNRDTIDQVDQKRLIDVGTTIGAQEKLTTEEMMSKGLDSLIEQFGPMLFSILKFLGFGKKSLLEMFPNAKDKINSMYLTEFGFGSDEKVKAVNEISTDINFETTPLKLKTGEQMEKAFQEKKDEYMDMIMGNTIKTKSYADEKYYTYLNIDIVKKGLNLYNKDKGTSLNINDIVSTEAEINPKTNKQTEKITSFKGDFESVLKTIIDNDAMRTRIAAANEEIKTEKTEKEVKTGFNEQGLTVTGDDPEAYAYLIQTEQDMARYLTAALFSNKDLAYVMTENELNNGKTVETETKAITYVISGVDGANLRNETTGKSDKLLAKDDVVTAALNSKGEAEPTKTAAELKFTKEELGLTTDDELTKQIYRKVISDTKEGWVLVDLIKEKTATVEVTTPVLTFKDVATDFDKDSKLTTAGAKKKIHEVVDMTNPVEKIKITRKNGTTVVNCTLNKTYTDTEITTATATYVDDTTSKRVYIYDGDKIEAAATAAETTVETAEQKFTKNRGLISGDTGVKKITEKKYGALEIKNFTYKADEKDADTLAYQTNILTPFETLLTDKDQYPLFINSLANSTVNNTGLNLFIDTVHLKNTLSMIDTRNKTNKYTDIIAKLSEGATYSVEVKKTDKTITITSTKEIITLSQKTEKDITTLEAVATKV